MIDKIGKFLGDRPELSAVFLFLLFWVFVFAAVGLLERDKSTYQVTVVYCDTRDPKVITVKSRIVPSNRIIKTRNFAVPVFASEVNVCDIQNVTLINK